MKDTYHVNPIMMLLMLVFVVSNLVTYFVHVGWAITGLMRNSLGAGEMLLAVLGTLIAPIGAIHGWIIIFS